MSIWWGLYNTQLYSAASCSPPLLLSSSPPLLLSPILSFHFTCEEKKFWKVEKRNKLKSLTCSAFSRMPPPWCFFHLTCLLKLTCCSYIYCYLLIWPWWDRTMWCLIMHCVWALNGLPRTRGGCRHFHLGWIRGWQEIVVGWHGGVEGQCDAMPP